MDDQLNELREQFSALDAKGALLLLDGELTVAETFLALLNAFPHDEQKPKAR
jgi:hypothetical protein